MTTIEKAWLYERFRLPYAPASVDELLERVGHPQSVADIGSGTGQLARMLAKQCTNIYAVEPDPAMRQVASAALATLENIDIRAGSAEQTTLATDSVELITIGNAFHRFRREACAEMRRILKPNGWVALYSYRFSNQAFSQMLFARLAGLQSTSKRIEQAWHRMPLEALFGDSSLKRLYYRQSHQEDWVAFFSSACSGIEAPEPQDRDFTQFEAINREVFDAFAVDGQIEIDYETEVVYGQLALA